MNKKRTFIVTGATRGIGFATAVHLHNQGHKIIGIARNKKATFPGTLYLADLSNAAATDEVFQMINQNHQIDGIVNNVGTAIPAPLGKIKIQDLHTVLDLNLRPAVQAVQIFMTGMLERKFGRIVNISSRAAMGAVAFSTYAAAKSGLIALTRSWALELATSNITVNTVAPGPTATESFILYAPSGSEEEKMILHKIPMQRFGRPDEVANAISFFLSDHAGYITGQTLFVDGGYSVK